MLIHFVGRWFLSLSLSLATRFVTFRSNVTLSGRFVRGIRDPVVFLNNTLTVRVEHGVYAWKVRDETETALIGRRSKRTKESRTTKWRRNFKEISRGILCLYLPPRAKSMENFHCFSKQILSRYGNYIVDFRQSLRRSVNPARSRSFFRSSIGLSHWFNPFSRKRARENTSARPVQ